MEQRNIQIKDYQQDFLKDQKLSFNFSAFVRDKLDEYIEFKRRLK